MKDGNNKPIKTKRELALERMQTRYPDTNFEDDEVLYGKIVEDYDDYDKQLADYKEREGAFANMFTADPRSAAFMMSWKNGDDPTVALVRQFGSEIKDAIDDPEKQEEIAAANKEFVERVAQAKEYEEVYQRNLAESVAYLDEFQAKNGMSDEEIDALMADIAKVASDGVMGKFSPETIEMFYKAKNHDADVSQAAYEGEVRGRNERIEEKLKTKSKGDGIGAMGSKTTPVAKPKTRNSIFDLAEEAL
jgi:hypothetical protein